MTEANLYHNREHFLGHLRNAPAHEHHALARKYGWVLVDLTCACGHKVKDHAVDTRSKVEDDLRVKPCGQCGARGAWKHFLAAKPSSPSAVLPAPVNTEEPSEVSGHPEK